jgi:protein-tyrosine-phosphatase
MNVDKTDGIRRRAAVHAALGDVTRLRIVDVLTVGDASASELASLLRVPSNLLAHHVGVLETVGLVGRHRSEGDGRRSYLTLLRGADGVPPEAPGPRLTPPRRVLFVCTANTARSHLAAALWRSASRVRVASAGTHPGASVHPAAVRAAARRGLRVPEVAPQDLRGIHREGDLVITVCDRAHEELAGADWAHWSVPDPVAAGTRTAFDSAIEDLAARVGALAPRMVGAG